MAVHVSCAVRSDKWLYEVYGRRIADGSLLFWVERSEAPGQVWMHISHSAVPVGVDPQTEFVAATEGGLNELLEEIAMSTGWFVRTGRVVLHPQGQRNEVWSITAACPIPTSAPTATDLRGLRLSELLAEWMRRMRDLNLTAVVVTVPDPFDGARPPRKLAGTLPGDLGPIFAKWNLDANAVRTGMEVGVISDFPQVGERMLERGYKTWVALRLPSLGGAGLEVLMFSQDESMDLTRAERACIRTLDLATHLWRAGADAVVPITDRERVVLSSAIEGKTSQQTAEELALSHHTVNYHLNNVIKKFGSTTKIHAAGRAIMLGSLLAPEQQR